MTLGLPSIHSFMATEQLFNEYLRAVKKKATKLLQGLEGEGHDKLAPIVGGRGNSASYFMPLDRKPVKPCHFGLRFTNLELANTNLGKGWFVLVFLFLKHWMRL